MAPIRGLRLSSKSDEIVVAIARATRTTVRRSAEIIAVTVTRGEAYDMSMVQRVCPVSKVEYQQKLMS